MTLTAKFVVEVCDPFAPTYEPIEGSPDMFKAIPHGGHVFLRAVNDVANDGWTERLKEETVPNGTLSLSITNEEKYQQYKVGQVHLFTMYAI